MYPASTEFKYQKATCITVRSSQFTTGKPHKRIVDPVMRLLEPQSGRMRLLEPLLRLKEPRPKYPRSTDC